MKTDLFFSGHMDFFHTGRKKMGEKLLKKKKGERKKVWCGTNIYIYLCVQVVKKASSILSCIGTCTASRTGKLCALRLALVRAHLKYCVHFWASPVILGCSSLCKEEHQNSWRDWETTPQEQLLREVGLFSLEKRRLSKGLQLPDRRLQWGGCWSVF